MMKELNFEYDIPVKYSLEDEEYMDRCWSVFEKGLNEIDSDCIRTIYDLWQAGQITIYINHLP